MLDNNVTQDIGLIHNLVTNDWFMLIAGLASIISLLITLFVANKVININKSITQNQQGKKNKQAGRDIN